MHVQAVAGIIFGNALLPQFSKIFSQLKQGQPALTYAADVMDRMKPRDPLELMLIVQALGAHARVLHLTNLANQQTTLDRVRTTHEYADKASNTYRRLILALTEYCRPPRTGDSFTGIKQANIAAQQVVNNVEQRENTTNEQGSSNIQHAENPPNCPEGGQTLSAEPQGPCIPESLRSQDEAVGAVHRSANG